MTRRVPVRAPEPLPGTRVVADPATLDGLWTDGGAILRMAQDEVLVLGGRSVVDDAAAVVEDEAGFVGWWLTPDELITVAHHVEWAIPDGRPALAQGLVAGVPARLWLTEERALLLVAAAYAHELVERLP
jgi:hypothetical protein